MYVYTMHTKIVSIVACAVLQDRLSLQFAINRSYPSVILNVFPSLEPSHPHGHGLCYGQPVCVAA